MITQEKVRSLFKYDDVSGNLIWIKSPSSHVKAGSVAGTGHKGYLRTRVKRKHLLVHRLVFLYHNGYMPEFIDHIDGDRRNNKIENIRECTASQNSQNKKISAANTTGVKGITFAKGREKYLAQIKSNGISYVLGTFNDIRLAEAELKTKRIELHGEFANHG